MKILVTGSEGVLGKVLVNELQTRGHAVVGCDLKHTEYGIRTDVCEWRQVDRVFDSAKPEIVYHLAAEFGRKNGQEYYEQLWKSNCIGTRNIIEACMKYKSHLVFASSSEVYGDVAESGELLQESSLTSTVPSFHNEYALTKYTNEKQILIASRNEGLNATILRFFNSYGPGEEYNDYRSVVALFTYRLLKNLPITVYKDYHRVFMYIGDWVRTVANVPESMFRLMSVVDVLRIFNIGGVEYTSIEELVKKLKDLIPESKSEIKMIPKELANVTNKRPDISKARTFLDHQCLINLNRGLPLTVEWMKKRYSL